MMAALLRNLRRAGLAHEAARVLTQRIELEKERARAAASQGAHHRAEPGALAAQARRFQRSERRARKEVEAALQASPEQPGGAGRAGPPAPQGERLRRLRRGPHPRGQGAGRQARGGGGVAGRRPRLPRAARRTRPRRATASRRRCARPRDNAEALRALAALLASQRRTGKRRAACSAAAGDHRASRTRAPRC